MRNGLQTRDGRLGDRRTWGRTGWRRRTRRCCGRTDCGRPDCVRLRGRRRCSSRSGDCLGLFRRRSRSRGGLCRRFRGARRSRRPRRTRDRLKTLNGFLGRSRLRGGRGRRGSFGGRRRRGRRRGCGRLLRRRFRLAVSGQRSRRGSFGRRGLEEDAANQIRDRIRHDAQLIFCFKDVAQPLVEKRDQLFGRQPDFFGELKNTNLTGTRSHSFPEVQGR